MWYFKKIRTRYLVSLCTLFAICSIPWSLGTILKLSAAYRLPTRSLFKEGSNIYLFISQSDLDEALKNSILTGENYFSETLIKCGSSTAGKGTRAEISPLQVAIIANNDYMIKRLLDLGVDINEYNNVISPLHMAALGKDPKVMKYLIARGADKNTILKDLRTIIQAAEARNHVELATYLKENFEEASSSLNTSVKDSQRFPASKK